MAIEEKTHKFPYRWNLANANFTKDKGTVFSCFSCGGGSTMGYKLVGFDVIGCNEIDHRMMKIYCKNHNPRYSFLEPIQEFKTKKDLPPELFNLDILDGSPPCSTFSIAGAREKFWGVPKYFKEGQKKQVLDTLFFDFIDLAKRLQPKVVVAENVKGLLIGKAKQYAQRIYKHFDDAGYHCQHWLLNSQTMGVPQHRERVFFVCLRKDLLTKVPCSDVHSKPVPLLDMHFNEKPIVLEEFADFKGRPITGPKSLLLWGNRQHGDHGLYNSYERLFNKRYMFNVSYGYIDKVVPTLTASRESILHYERPLHLSAKEIICASSYPQDYDFDGLFPNYICGMSVPPVMMAQVASRINEQWLLKIKENTTE